jgi:RNA polymerase sigma-70 factor (ECF subfamily)
MAENLVSSLHQARTQPSAFSNVYSATARGVLAYFVRRTYDVEVAADLTAETFACAFEGRETFRGSTDDELASWLYGIASHQLSRYARKGKVERKAIERLAIRVPEVAPDDHERILELAGLSDMRTQVARAFSSLPSRQRAALRLRVIEECSYREVADTLGISEQSARARVSRALSRLADAPDLSTPREVTP